MDDSDIDNREDSLDSSLVAPYGSPQQPESNSIFVELPYAGIRDFVRTYGDEPSMNSPDLMGRKSNSFQYSERNNQFGNSSMPNDGHVSVHQSSDGSDSSDHTIIGNSLSDDEKLSLRNMQPQGGMGSYHSEVYQQAHSSLQSLSPLQESQANLTLEDHNIPATHYASYNHHNHQNTSLNHEYNVVIDNHIAMLGEINHSVYQHQVGRPNISVGASQFTSQQQAGQVVFPNCSAVLGEANHNVYQNQTGRPNESIGINQNASQYYPNKVALPNHSAVLTERNPNLPLVAQHQSNFSLTRSGPVSSGDQTASSSQNISLPGNGTEAQPISVMSQRNRKLDMQNLQNITIPPTLIQDEPGSNYSSIYKIHEIPQCQNYPQSQMHVENNRMQQHSAGNSGKKVFILHFPESVNDNPVLKLGLVLRQMKVDVTLDLLERDRPSRGWAIWYEEKISESNVVLCIITKSFYHQLTNSSYVLGYSVYNLMNNRFRNIAFRAVFIDAKKELEHIPPAMGQSTCYSICSNRLIPEDDEFANLYAFLTGQNRIMKPPLGKKIILAPIRVRCKSNFRIIYFQLCDFVVFLFW